METRANVKLSVLLKSIANSKKIIDAFINEDTLEVLYKNGIADLNVVEIKALSDVVKNKSDSHIADSLDDARAIWKEIVDKIKCEGQID